MSLLCRLRAAQRASLRASGSSAGSDFGFSSGFALIELLVVMALIVILAGGMYSFYAGKGGSKKGEAKTPLSVAHDSECLQNLGSVRQCIKAEEATDDEKHPDSLIAIKSVPAELRACPVGKEPYAYDPATGQIHCVHPGHESY